MVRLKGETLPLTFLFCCPSSIAPRWTFFCVTQRVRQPVLSESVKILNLMSIRWKAEAKVGEREGKLKMEILSGYSEGM